MGLRAGDEATIPLCPCHHRLGDGSEAFEGHIGYHYSPEEFETTYETQEFLLELTNKILEKTQ